MEEVDLVERCKRGDLSAFESLYRLHMPRALRTAYLFTKSKPEAEDVVQEAFIQVWRRLGTLREPTAFRSWFYRTLLHAARRVHRGKGKTEAVPLDLKEHDRPDIHTSAPHEQAEYGEELRELRAAIATLPEPQRMTLVLRYYSGLTEPEVAQVLEIPLGTVKSRLHHARLHLHSAVTRKEAMSDGR